jgi:hypothetical protein
VEPGPRSRSEIASRSRSQLRLLSFYHRHEEILQTKFMVEEEVFCKLLKIFIPLLQSKKVIFKVPYKIIQSWGRSRNSDLRLRGAGAERNIFGSTTLHTTIMLT